MTLVRKVVEEVGAQSSKDIALTKGRADGKFVNELVRKILNGEM